MHIRWKHDPRVEKKGAWSTTGRILGEKRGEMGQLKNFLDSFLVERHEWGLGKGLQGVYMLDVGKVLVPFAHAETLINFIETMGWTWEIEGE